MYDNEGIKMRLDKKEERFGKDRIGERAREKGAGNSKVSPWQFPWTTKI